VPGFDDVGYHWFSPWKRNIATIRGPRCGQGGTSWSATPPGRDRGQACHNWRLPITANGSREPIARTGSGRPLGAGREGCPCRAGSAVCADGCGGSVILSCQVLADVVARRGQEHQGKATEPSPATCCGGTRPLPSTSRPTLRRPDEDREK
jgi:hypothetical protein